MTYDDITRPENNHSNMGGTKMRLFYADYNDILTHAAIGTITDPKDAYIKVTAPVFKTGKRWQYIDVALHSGKNIFDSIGETDGKAFNQKPSFSVPATQEEALPLINCPNGIWVFGIPMANGKNYIIGDLGFPAEIKPTGDGGDNKGNGGMFNFEVECFVPNIFLYTGAFSLTPAA